MEIKDAFCRVCVEKSIFHVNYGKCDNDGPYCNTCGIGFCNYHKTDMNISDIETCSICRTFRNLDDEIKNLTKQISDIKKNKKKELNTSSQLIADSQ
jgi:hypothetical protein